MEVVLAYLHEVAWWPGELSGSGGFVGADIVDSTITSTLYQISLACDQIHLFAIRFVGLDPGLRVSYQIRLYCDQSCLSGTSIVLVWQRTILEVLIWDILG